MPHEEVAAKRRRRAKGGRCLHTRTVSAWAERDNVFISDTVDGGKKRAKVAATLAVCRDCGAWSAEPMKSKRTRWHHPRAASPAERPEADCAE